MAQSQIPSIKIRAWCGYECNPCNMTTILTDIETRVLGSLIEKQVTTPEYYPLTLNALTLACNQKNNRHPVTAYSENQVADAVESLREKNLDVRLLRQHQPRSEIQARDAGSDALESPLRLALMCVLMLRGAQTPGELRGQRFTASRVFQSGRSGSKR